MQEIGNFGNGPYKSGTREYRAWRNMIVRCYSPLYHEVKPAYIGCSVCEEWLNYQVFARWFEDNYIEGYSLDKDILFKGNKVYSPTTCCFVPKELNNLIISNTSSRGELPIGIVKHQGKYRARISIDNIYISLGMFDTIQEAFDAYKRAKESNIKRIADIYMYRISEPVYQALYNYTVDISD
jgi:hypothetical protein